ncbi:MAG: lipoyl synthase [Bacteroidota bacterium]
MARGRLPRWMKAHFPMGERYSRVKNIVQQHQLHTICTSGTCPNIGECWGNGTATFMILGDICTRSCKFCGVKSGKPEKPDVEEPKRLAESIKLMGIKHCVITSVDRDDLPDGGASFWAETIRVIKDVNPEVTMEVLIPDFDGDKDCIQKVIDAEPDVISHNLETVERITPKVRSRANYKRSLGVIRTISDAGIVAKSGIMVGIGEKESEIYQTMDDLLKAGCKVFTIGQYLQPADENIPVERYLTPAEFEKFHKMGMEKGFAFVESSPLVRSSYHAEKHINA